MPKRLIICSDCGKERLNISHGLCDACYRKQRRSKNPDAAKSSARRFYATHRDAELARNRQWEASHYEERLIYRKELFAKMSWEKRTLNYGSVARLTSRKELSISFLRDLREHTVCCPSCGAKLDYSVTPRNEKRKQNSATLDKIIPSLCYVTSNVAIICWRCNRLKCNMTIEDIRMLLRYVETHAVLGAAVENC